MNEHTSEADNDTDTIVRSRLVTRTRDTAVARNAILHTFHVRGLDVIGGSDFSFEETLTGTPLLALESTTNAGHALLTAVDDHARCLQAPAVVYETAPQLVEPISVLQQHGYQQIAPWRTSHALAIVAYAHDLS